MMWMWGILIVIAVGSVFFVLYQKDIQEKQKTSTLMSATMDILSKETRNAWQQSLAQLTIKHTAFIQLQTHLKEEIVGMDAYLHGLFITLLVSGHALVEGVPGLAKTKTITLLSRYLDLSFQRIQFTPDMLPSDIIGAEIFDPKSQQFTVLKGPIFAHCILADEINRTTPKVQSALLEAMQEGQVTISGKTFPLPKPFFVLATQNPLEHEGTYPLPEAQVDRFLLHIVVDYPSYEQEQDIVKKQQGAKEHTHTSAVFSLAQLTTFQKEVQNVTISDALLAYAVRLVQATRTAQSPFSIGASPRASLALVQSAKAVAWLKASTEVSLEDLQMMAVPVLRHRVALAYDRKRQGISLDDQLVELLIHVPIIV